MLRLQLDEQERKFNTSQKAVEEKQKKQVKYTEDIHAAENRVST